MPLSSAGQEPLRRTLQGLELRCPPLPQTLIEALDLIGKPEKMEVGPVTEMVQRDPIVVARLLHTVNSAYYGLRHTISSADRAVVMLGPVAVAGIVLGMHMLKLRSILENPANACFQRLIRHSIACAFLTRHMLDGTPREAGRGKTASRMSVSFTTGLLHDFGKIILVYNFQQDALDLYDGDAIASQVDTRDELEIERLVFGCDHTEAGEFAARKLQFPEVLVQVIRHHHHPAISTGDGETDRLIRVTAGADIMANAMGYGFTNGVDPGSVAENQIWLRIVTEDLSPFDSPETLVEELLAQQDHLDRYVHQLTEAQGAASDGRAANARDRIWRLNP